MVRRGGMSCGSSPGSTTFLRIIPDQTDNDTDTPTRCKAATPVVSFLSNCVERGHLDNYCLACTVPVYRMSPNNPNHGSR